VKIQYHYAPLTGELLRTQNGVAEIMANWQQYHELKATFLELRHAGELRLVDTKLCGHTLFHNRSGRVDIYEKEVA